MSKIKSCTIENGIVLTVYVAENKINRFMESFDMKNSSTWFIITQEVYMKTKKNFKASKKFFFDLIEKSKLNKNSWIPDIGYNGKLYVAKDVRELSNGDTAFFIPFDDPCVIQQ